MKQKIMVVMLAIVCLGLVVQPVWAATEQVAVKPAVTGTTAAELPDPSRLVLAMTTYMKSLPQFYVSGEALYDKVYADNNKIQYAYDFDFYVKRPGQFQFNMEGDLQNKQFLFDGKTLTAYDEDKAVYAVIDVPGTIDGVLDKAAKEYGLEMAIFNIARSDFGDNLLKDVVKSAYVGPSSVGNIPCRHVAFVKEDLTMQLWIEEGDKPFLRKFLVTFKKDPAMPTASVEISDWTLSPVLPEGWTTFVPKPGMKKIEFMKPTKQPNSQTL